MKMSMKLFYVPGLVAVFLISMGIVRSISAQDGSVQEGGRAEVVRSDDSKAADKPTRGVVLRLFGGKKQEESNPLPPIEPTGPAEEPSEPGEETDIPPTFLGEPIGGKTVLILDASMSMQEADVGSEGIEDWNNNVLSSPTRIQLVKIETINALRNMRESDEFDLMELAGAEFAHPPLTDSWSGKLVQATKGNKERAIQYVIDLQLRYGTPTRTVLQRVCNEYGDKHDKLFLISDGAPTVYDVPDVSGPPWQSIEAGKVVNEEFIGWYSELRKNGCELVCVHIGNNNKAGTFMKDLAATHGGRYIHR